MSLIVTGTIGIDTVETMSGSARGVLGGSCAYFAAAASLFGPVRLVAAVGGDWPDEHRAVLEGFRNIDTAGLEVRPDSKTFAWGGRYGRDVDQRETLYTDLGVLAEDPPGVPEAFRDSEYIFLANTHPQVQTELLGHFPRPRLVVADTMNLWIDTARDTLLPLFNLIDGIVLNDEEAEQLTGAPNAITAGRRILDLGPAFAVVKKGQHGCLLVHRDGMAVLPAYPVQEEAVVDPTGAGDSFAGGMMGHIAAQGRTDLDTIRAALGWATVTASFTLQSFSLDALARLKREQLDERMDEFRRLVQVG